MMFYWCTLVLTLVPVVTGDNSGVTFKLTQKGLDLVAGKAIEKLKQLIQQMDIPDQTIPIPLKPYTVTGMKINIDKLVTEQKFFPKTGVTIKIDSANIHVTGNLVSGQSSNPLDLDVSSLAITATVAVNSDESGHLKLSIENCKAIIGSFRGDPLRLVSAVLSGFNSVIPSFLGNRICSKMTTTLADFNPKLATLNDNIRALSGIYFSMEPTVISSDSIELGFVGQNGRKKRRLLEETKALLRMNI